MGHRKFQITWSSCFEAVKYIFRCYVHHARILWERRRNTAMQKVKPDEHNHPACLNAWIMIILLPALTNNSPLEEKKKFNKTKISSYTKYTVHISDLLRPALAHSSSTCNHNCSTQHREFKVRSGKLVLSHFGRQWLKQRVWISPLFLLATSALPKQLV